MKTLARLGGIVAAAAALVGATSVPASANDARLAIWHNDVRRALATYDDLTDTLCLRLDTTRRAVAVIHAPGVEVQRGHSVELWWDSADHYHCTGNLSIPEDRRWILEVGWGDYAGTYKERSVEFYT